MKIYTADIETTQPANKAVRAPLNSRYGIGLKFTEDGAPKEFAADEVKMDGLSADDVVDGMFVYMRESGAEPGCAVHDVEAGSPGFQASDRNVISGTLSTRIRQFATSVTLSSLIDEPTELTYDQLLLYHRSTINAPVEDVEYISDNYSGGGAYGAWINSDGTGAGTAIYLRPELRKFGVSDPVSGWTYYDKMTFSPAAKATYSGGFRGSGTLWLDVKVDINVPSTIKHYKVTETAEDQGVALGFNEKYVLTDTIELSGTNEDDSEFSYELPITN